MKKLILFNICLIFTLLIQAQSATTFILVRHAEKADDGTRNPPLNEMGQERASNLADMLSNQEITALFSTPFKRTQETLQSIASSKNLVIQDYDPASKKEWLETIINKHAGGTIVISGHSNTIPLLANELLGREVFQQFDESDYGNFIIIVTSQVGNGKLVRLKF